MSNDEVGADTVSPVRDTAIAATTPPNRDRLGLRRVNADVPIADGVGTEASRAARIWLYSGMERVIVMHASHESAAAADRAELKSMSPQARLDRLLRLQQAYREQLGDAGRGLARVARVIDRAPR